MHRQSVIQLISCVINCVSSTCPDGIDGCIPYNFFLRLSDMRLSSVSFQLLPFKDNTKTSS